MHCFVRTAKLIGRAGGILFALIFWYFCIKTKVRKKKKEISINSFRNFWLQAFIKVGHCFLGNYFPQTAINGNISCLSTDYYTTTPLLKSFRYDKLNRIKQMQTAGISAGEWGNLTNNFSTEYWYDYNGNILSLQRKDANAQIMHQINYTYNAKNNRLQAITATGINSSNYSYDAIGNLANDSGENVGVTWNAMNKVKQVNLPNNRQLQFSYSPTGQRQIKKTGDKTEYYLHDATGNIMCVYELSGNYLTVKERTIYGSKRIGVYRQRIQLTAFTGFGQAELLPGSGLVNVLHPSPIISPDGRQYLEGSNRLQVIGVVRTTLSVNTLAYKKGTIELKGLSPSIAARPTFLDGTKTAGLRDYELTDHLSNVMAVINDRKLSVDANSDTITDYYAPQVVSFTDYYPFGFPIAERSGNLSEYRFGFNGKEDDNEVYSVRGSLQNYGERMYITLTGRFISPDPLIVYQKKYPELSTYQFASNTPIWGSDWDGLEVRIYTETTGLTGHTFLTVGSGDDIIVYTYGRYLGGNKGKSSSASTDPSGRGVLIKLTGNAAKQYVSHELNDLGAKSFEITDANEYVVKKVSDKVFGAGRKLTNQEKAEYKVKYGTSDDARVIDQYDLLKNNCTTKAIDATKAGGTDVDYIYNTGPVAPDIPNLQYEINIPADLQDYLLDKSKEKNSNVKNVTGTVKKEVKTP